jgi:hypothetical protein
VPNRATAPDGLPGKTASGDREGKPLPAWYARLYRRRLTVCLWLLAAACVFYLAPLVWIWGSFDAVQILGCLYWPGLAFCLWTGLKALSAGNRRKAVGAAVLYLVWYAVFQLISAEGDFRLLLLMIGSYFVTGAFAAGAAFLVHTLCVEKKYGFIPFIVVALLCLSDLSACITGIANLRFMQRYSLAEDTGVIVAYCCDLLAAFMLTAAFTAGMLPGRFGARAVEGWTETDFDAPAEDEEEEEEEDKDNGEDDG